MSPSATVSFFPAPPVQDPAFCLRRVADRKLREVQCFCIHTYKLMPEISGFVEADFMQRGAGAKPNVDIAGSPVGEDAPCGGMAGGISDAEAEWLFLVGKIENVAGAHCSIQADLQACPV